MLYLSVEAWLIVVHICSYGLRVNWLMSWEDKHQGSTIWWASIYDYFDDVDERDEPSPVGKKSLWLEFKIGEERFVMP